MPEVGAEPREPSVESGVTLPASYAQERLWLVLELGPPTPAYNVWAAWRLRGPLDVDALQAAFDAVVARHETLRTTFAVVDGCLAQVVHEPSPAWFDVAAAVVNDPAADAFVGQVARTIFDLKRGPLFRIGLAPAGDAEHVLAVCAHHLVADGWSLGVLAREVSELYRARVDGRPAALPDLAVQYADFAAWQREWLEGDEIEHHLTWWREALSGAPLVLDLPADRPRPPEPSFAGANIGFDLGDAATDALRALARRHGTTPFAVAVAAFGAVIGRHAAQDDILVGAAAAGRNRPELEALVGFFVNTLVVRVDLRGDPTVAELLRRVHAHVLDGLAHEDLPFERLVADLRPHRTADRNPVFQAMVTMAPGPAPAPDLPGIDAVPVDVDDATSTFDLIVELTDTGPTFAGMLRAAADLFDVTTTRRFVDQFRHLLGEMATDGERRVSELNLAPARAVPRPAEAPSTTPVPALVAVQAQRTPDAVAASGDGRDLTYRELDRRARAIATRLHEGGVRPGSTVAVAGGPTPDLLVGLLGVMYAGAAYLPLAPGDPPERVGFSLRDAGVGVGLAADPLGRAALKASGAPVEVLAIDADDDDLGPAAMPIAAVALDDVAYVIYTSGSTGTPKGVLVTHRGLANYIGSAASTYGCPPGTIAPALTPATVDLTVTALFVPLVTGGAVAFVDDDDWVGAVRRLAADREIGLLKLTPSHVAVLAKHPDGADVAGRVRTAVIGGEQLTAPHLRWWREHAPRTCLVNEYGPTETTVGCAAHVVTDADLAGDRWRIPIGGPLPGASLHVLDRRLRPVPPGVPGELYVGGDGLARGYTGTPNRTAAVFVPDGHRRGARVYRTGDRVRERDDGELEFLGRADDQIKLRGHRIEPAEIESALAAHPDIDAAAVTLTPGPAGDDRLVAFVATRPSAALDPNEVRARLRRSLPAAMIPAAFVPVDRLPLTPSGKVDRGALRATASVGAAAGGPDPVATDPPRSAAEQAVAEAIADLLGIDGVGRDDDFFDLGGHSLLAMQLAARVHAELDAAVALRDVFAGRTVAGIAAAVAAAGDAPPPPPPITRVPRHGPLPLTAAEQRLWLLHRIDPERHDYNAPYAFRIAGPLDRPALEAALRDLVVRHEALRTRYIDHEGHPARVIDPPGRFAVPVRAVDDFRKARVHAHELARRPFRLDREHGLRVELLRLAEDDHLLVIVLHHMVSDGWSFSVLVRELSARYRGHKDGAPAPVVESDLHPADVAAWEHARGDQESGLARWADMLRGAPGHLDLPLDRPRPPETSPRGATVVLALDDDAVAALEGIAARARATPYMVGLAAFATLLHRTAGQDDIVVGTAVAGRARREMEPVVGFFVNTLALRVDVSGGPTFAELLARVRTLSVDAFGWADVPFEAVVEAVDPDRHGGRTPLFSVMFGVNDVTDDLALDGAVVSDVALDIDVAQVDLILELARSGTDTTATWTFATDLFDATTIEKLAERFVAILHAAGRDTATPVATIDLLGPEGITSAGVDRGALVPGRYEGVATRVAAVATDAPDRVAVICGDDTVSYGELISRAGGLARRLTERAGGGEPRVGVFLPRSADAAIAFVAALAAGVPYVPLDPGYPRERLALLAADAAVDMVVTTPDLAHLAPAGAGEVILVGDEAHLDTGPSPHPGFAGAWPADALAYVMYTSGSTGRPKGVAVSHGNLDWAYRAWAADFSDGRPVTVAVAASPAFDVFTGLLVAALCSGGTLLVCPEDVVLVPDVLDRYLRDHGAGFIDTVPAVVNALVDAAERAGRDLGYLRWLVAGADVWRTADLERAQRVCGPGTTVLNAYGVTEATIDSTRYVAVPGAPPATAVAPIGRAIPGSTTYVLDPNGARYPTASSVSCTSVAKASPAATSTGPDSPPPDSCPTRSHSTPEHVATAPVTASGAGPAATWTSSVGPTTR
nr:condensation domain-containing protein [uncultured bacterium]